MRTVLSEKGPRPGHSVSHHSPCSPSSGVNGGCGVLDCHVFSLTAITVQPVAMPVSVEVTVCYILSFGLV